MNEPGIIDANRISLFSGFKKGLEGMYHKMARKGEGKQENSHVNRVIEP
jgi:hypothetical protein